MSRGFKYLFIALYMCRFLSFHHLGQSQTKNPFYVYFLTDTNQSEEKQRETQTEKVDFKFNSFAYYVWLCKHVRVFKPSAQHK